MVEVYTEIVGDEGKLQEKEQLWYANTSATANEGSCAAPRVHRVLPVLGGTREPEDQQIVLLVRESVHEDHG